MALSGINRLVSFAKSTGTALYLVGHVTKDGSIAGPRVLEHMVDATLYFEGDSGGRHRMIRAMKNRFGAINELRVDVEAQNYLYTNRAVPFHWDGAFVGRVPHVIFFHCAQAPPDGLGGETLFCNTVDLVESLTREEREHLHTVTITYSTDKIAHYGGQFTAPLLSTHPVTPHSVMRFAEPVDDLNPVHLEITGVEPKEREAFLEWE